MLSCIMYHIHSHVASIIHIIHSFVVVVYKFIITSCVIIPYITCMHMLSHSMHAYVVTYTHTHIYIYIYICVCVCVCDFSITYRIFISLYLTHNMHQHKIVSHFVHIETLRIFLVGSEK